jgi:hypothetical protein
MSTEQYGQLIDQLLILCDISPSPVMHEVCNLKIEGTPVTLFYGDSMYEGCVVSFCDFGEIPEAREAKVQRQALETNMQLLGKNMPHFVMNAETKHLLLVTATPFEGLIANELLATLTAQAISSQTWQESYLSETDNPALPAG